MSRNNDLLEKARRAQKIAEESGLDEKYKPFLFLHLLHDEQQTKDSPEATKGQIRPKHRPDSGKASATTAIGTLYGEGYFVQGRRLQEVIGKLSERGFHFGYSPTRMALQRAKYLRSEGVREDRKYLQRYPPK